MPQLLRVQTLTANMFYVDGKKVSSEFYHRTARIYPVHSCLLTEQIPGRPNHFRHWTTVSKEPEMPKKLSSIHDELTKLLQKFATDHGIKVNCVNVNWLDVHNISETKAIIESLIVTTETQL